MDVLARERPCHGATAGRADEGGERRTSRMIMPCSRPPLMRYEEEGRGAEEDRMVSLVAAGRRFLLIERVAFELEEC